MAVELEIQTEKAQESLKKVETSASNLEAALNKFNPVGFDKTIERLEKTTGVPATAVASVDQLSQASGRLGSNTAQIANVSNSLTRLGTANVQPAATGIGQIAQAAATLTPAPINAIGTALSTVATTASSSAQTVSGAVNTMKGAAVSGATELTKVGTASKTAAGEVSGFSSTLSKVGQGVGAAVGSLLALRGAIVALGLVTATNYLIDLRQAMYDFNQVVRSYQTPEEIKKTEDMIRMLAATTGQSAGQIQNAYSLFAQAAQRAGISVDQTNDSFTRAEIGLRGLGTTSENTNVVMKQFGAGLRGTAMSVDAISDAIGVRGPQAVEAMADALGMSEQSFRNLASEGKLTSDQILTSLTELGTKFGSELPNNVNLFKQVAGGATNGLQQNLAATLPTMTEVTTKSVEMSTGWKAVGQSLQEFYAAAGNSPTLLNSIAQYMTQASTSAAKLDPSMSSAAQAIAQAAEASSNSAEFLAQLSQMSDQASTSSSNLSGATDNTTGSINNQNGSAASLTSQMYALAAALREAAAAQRELNSAQGGSGGGGGGDAPTEVPSYSGGGLTSAAPAKTEFVDPSIFKGAPQFAEGGKSNGGIPAILHPNEAVVPLTAGGAIPVAGIGGAQQQAGAGDGLLSAGMLGQLMLRVEEQTEVIRQFNAIYIDKSDIMTSEVIKVQNTIVEQTKALDAALQAAAKIIAESRTPKGGGGGGETSPYAGNYFGAQGFGRRGMFGTRDINDIYHEGEPGDTWGAPGGARRFFATGSPNASEDAMTGGAFSAVLHPDEAVIPLPDGRTVPVTFPESFQDRPKTEDSRPRIERTRANVTVQMTVVTKDADSFRRSEDQLLQELRSKLDKVTETIGGDRRIDDPTKR